MASRRHYAWWILFALVACQGTEPLEGLAGGPSAGEDLGSGSDADGQVVTDASPEDGSEGALEREPSDLGVFDPCDGVAFPTDALVHYRLQGSAPEASRRGNATQPFAVQGALDRRQREGGAALFDGTQSRVDLGSAFSDLRLPVSLSMWAWLDQDENRFRTLLETAESPSDYRGLWLQLGTGGNLGISFGNGGPLRAAGRRSAFSSETLPVGRWVHVVAVVEGPDSFALYFDGTARSFGLSGEARQLQPGPGIGRIGSTLRSPSSGWRGRIDDVRIYGRALTRCEVRRLAEE